MIKQTRKCIVVNKSQREYLDGQLAYQELSEKLSKILKQYSVKDHTYGLPRNIINTVKKYGAVELIVEETGYTAFHEPKYVISYKPRKDLYVD